MSNEDATAPPDDNAANQLAEALARVRRRLALVQSGPDSRATPFAAMAPMLDMVETLSAQLTAASVQAGDSQSAGAVLARVQAATMLHGCRHWLETMDLQLSFMAAHASRSTTTSDDTDDDGDAGDDGMSESRGGRASPAITVDVDGAFVDDLNLYLQQLERAWERRARELRIELRTLTDELRKPPPPPGARPQRVKN